MLCEGPGKAPLSGILAPFVVYSRKFICLYAFCSHMSACDILQQDPGQRQARPVCAHKFYYTSTTTLFCWWWSMWRFQPHDSIRLCSIHFNPPCISTHSVVMWFRVWTWHCVPILLVDLRWSSFGSVRGSQLHCVNLCRIQYIQLRIHRTPHSCDFVVKGYILCTLITGCFAQGGFPQTFPVSTQNVLTHIIKNVSEKLFPKSVYSEWWCLFVNVCLFATGLKTDESRGQNISR